jgi:hypothetical protein
MYVSTNNITVTSVIISADKENTLIDSNFFTKILKIRNGMLRKYSFFLE